MNEFDYGARRAPEFRRGFFRARWHGLVPLERLLWRDMFLVATALNVAASAAALLMLGFKAPTWLALTTHFALVPYNLFLTLSVWRTAERIGESTVAYMTFATLWLVLVTVI